MGTNCRRRDGLRWPPGPLQERPQENGCRVLLASRQRLFPLEGPDATREDGSGGQVPARRRCQESGIESAESLIATVCHQTGDKGRNRCSCRSRLFVKIFRAVGDPWRGRHHINWNGSRRVADRCIGESSIRPPRHMNGARTSMPSVGRCGLFLACSACGARNWGDSGGTPASTDEEIRAKMGKPRSEPTTRPRYRKRRVQYGIR